MADTAVEVDAALRALRDAGLVVRQHGESVDRFHIRRPLSVAGNRRVYYCRNLIGFRNGEPVVLETVDAPMSVLEHPPGDVWMFRAWEFCPGPGPGDFERSYSSLGEAVSAILDYYFGDSAWMCAEWESYRTSRRFLGPGLS